jgi:hypothetical protein
MVVSRNGVSLQKVSPSPVARLAAPTRRKAKKASPSRSPYHWIAPAS